MEHPLLRPQRRVKYSDTTDSRIVTPRTPRRKHQDQAWRSDQKQTYYPIPEDMHSEIMSMSDGSKERKRLTQDDMEFTTGPNPDPKLSHAVRRALAPPQHETKVPSATGRKVGTGTRSISIPKKDRSDESKGQSSVIYRTAPTVHWGQGRRPPVPKKPSNTIKLRPKWC